MAGVSAFLAAFGASGQVSKDAREAYLQEQRERFVRMMAYEDRIRETEPHRRDGPLRDLNVSDGEVLEIRETASEVYGGDMVYISSVVNGCPCEDGAGCSDQVWVMTHDRKDLFDGILLSRIDQHWKIGAVQRWWLERARLTARRKAFKSDWDYREAEESLTLSFPACAAEIDRLMEPHCKPNDSR